MKRVVSVSLGSSTRNHEVEVELLGQRVRIERVGTDGDTEKATQLYNELDGKVDALGVGGIDLGVHVGDRNYPLYPAVKLVAGVRQTPVVDGGGLKHTIERRLAQFVEQEIGDQIAPKTVLLTSAASRFGTVLSFDEAGYDAIYGDLMFALGLPIPLRGVRTVKVLAAMLLPVLGHLPISMIYPTGEKQEVNVPKFEKYYRWASVVSGDFLYVKQHMPLDMSGKVVVTNTTTTADVEFLTQRGVRYLITATPRLEGRSFGTNAMEAALIAISGKGRELTTEELEDLIAQLNMKPTIEKLN